MNDLVACPYCDKQLKIIQHTHLKSHGKTMQDFRTEFPDHPIRCQSMIEAARRGSEANKTNKDRKKKVKCVCKKQEKWVGKFDANYVYLDCCGESGFSNPDKRTKSETQTKREATFMRDYGVINPHQIPEAIEKANKTSDEKHKGRGFASKKLARKAKKTMVEKGYFDGQDIDNIDDVNIMQTEEGLYRFVKGMKQKYGENITNPRHILEVIEKANKTLRKKWSKEGHHLKGRTYIDIYGEEAAKKFIELRKRDGAKGFKKSLEMGYGPSKPQLELFKVVKQVIPEARLEFGQNLQYNDKRYYYFLDIAIPDLKLNIEYDCAWTHPDPEKDAFRDKVLESFGWKTLRYFEKIPSKEELENDINKVL